MRGTGGVVHAWCSFLVSACLLFSPLEAVYSACCENVSGRCRTACEMITLIDLATKPERHKLFTAHLDYHCGGADNLDQFRLCFNYTTKELQRGSNWTERSCCVFAKDHRCRIACVYVRTLRTQKHNLKVKYSPNTFQSQSLYELEPVCWPNKEGALYECVKARKDAARCCTPNGPKKISDSCSNFCLEMLPIKRTHLAFSYAELILLHAQCPHSSETVHCVWRLGETPQEPLQCGPCCNSSPNALCKQACQDVANKSRSGIAAVESLIGSGCGAPDPQEPFWICLLKGLAGTDSGHSAFVTTKSVVNPDTMKLHCCSKASNELCMQACFRAYGLESVSRDVDDFLVHCMDAADQTDLRKCLHDVSAPCEFGCSHLHFCSAYNDHSAMSFRSCDRTSDREAQLLFEKWKSELHVSLKNNSEIAIRFDQHCSRVWKGLACATSIEPCQFSTGAHSVCRSDCVAHVTKCIVPSRQSSAELLCSRYFEPDSSIKNHSSCLPLLSGEEEIISTVLKVDHDVSELTPCNPNPCPDGMRCEVQRFNERYTNTSIVCLPGCLVEESRHRYVLAQDTFFIMPFHREGFIGYSTCVCTANGMAANCEDIGLIEKVGGCWFGNQYYVHGRKFMKSCSRCVCLFGEIICSAGYCLNEAQRDEERNAITGLPCSCPVVFNRVCGRNGKTYPTECSARCAGLSEHYFIGGKCSVVYSCPRTQCGDDKWCVERSEVCLDHLTPCNQHTCVDLKTNCEKQPAEVACDEDAHEHRNLCSLVMSGKRFAYMGKCLQGCSSSGVVCGHNAETFSSECSALAYRVGIDYPGNCVTVGGRVEEGLVDACATIRKQCPPRKKKKCFGFVPPDSCCPICAGGLRVLFSRNRVQQLVEQKVISLTTRKLLTELQKLIQSSICEVLGYLSMENDMVVIVRRINVSNTLHFDEQTCVLEAERIHYLIDTQSPIITMNAHLWPLVSSKIIHIPLASSAFCSFAHAVLFLLLTFFTLSSNVCLS